MAGDVWRSIRDLGHVHVRVDDIPPECGGGVVVRQPDGQVWILLDADRPAHERRAILAHELEHLRRGSARFDGAPPTWHSVIAKEERIVDQAVALRLVPLDELRQFASARTSLGEPVTVTDVAEHFDVPERVAAEACRLAR